MADGILGAVDGSIMGGRPMPVAVPGVEVEIRQLGIRPQSLRQGGGDALAEPLVEFGDQPEAAGALERFEVVSPGWAMRKIKGMLLEKSTTRRQFVEDALQAQVQPSLVGQARAIAGVGAIHQELLQGG